METLTEDRIQTSEAEGNIPEFSERAAAGEIGQLATVHVAEFRQPGEGFEYSDLISQNTWERLTSRIEEKEGVSGYEAERLMNESLGFLKACGDNPEMSLSPSEKVDIGWHNFILYTREYAEFCDSVAGGFIHHEPNDDIVQAPESEGQSLNVTETLDFLKEKGYKTDDELWVNDSVEAEAGRCSSHCRNTCNHSVEAVAS